VDDIKLAKLSNYISNLDSNNYNIILINNLLVDTYYNIYCYTSDYLSRIMPLNIALETKILIKTKGYRKLYLTNSYSFITSNSIELFYLSLSSKPTHLIYVNLSLSSCLSLSSSSLSSLSDEKNTIFNDKSLIQPSSFLFTDQSIQLTNSFKINITIPGCYIVKAIASSSSSNSNSTSTIDYYRSSNLSFIVHEKNSTIDPPKVKHLIFNDQGTSLLLKFLSDTNKGMEKIFNYNTIFNCSLLLKFDYNKLTKCKWLDASILSIDLLSSNYKPNIDDTIILLDNIIKSKYIDNTNINNYKYLSTIILIIQSPLNPIQPKIILISPSTLYSCDDLIINPTSTYGNSGRLWLSLQWIIETDLNYNYNLSQYLNFNYKDTWNLVTIPNNLIQGHTILSIYLKVTNFLGMSDINNIIIKINSNNFNPYLSIYSSNTQMYRSNKLSLIASSYYPTCMITNIKKVKFNYEWKVYRGVQYLPLLKSMSLESNIFKLDSYILEAATSYTIVVIVTAEVVLPSSSSSLLTTTTTSSIITTTSSSIYISLGRLGVKAILNNNAPSITASVSQVINLDGSDSTDLDYPQSSFLTYIWKCQIISPIYGKDCNNNFMNQNKAIININEGYLISNYIYNITLTVKNNNDNIDSTFMILNIIEENIPIISIQSYKSKIDKS